MSERFGVKVTRIVLISTISITGGFAVLSGIAASAANAAPVVSAFGEPWGLAPAGEPWGKMAACGEPWGCRPPAHTSGEPWG